MGHLVRTSLMWVCVFLLLFVCLYLTDLHIVIGGGRGDRFVVAAVVFGDDGRQIGICVSEI